MTLRGYRDGDRALLSGDWVAGELLGLPPGQRSRLAETATLDAPQDGTAELCVLDGAGVVRFGELDWIHRRARLEIGLQASASDRVSALLKEVLTHAFEVLNLHRVYGWVTPAAGADTSVLAGAGFQREAAVPASGWLGGHPVTREIWAVVRRD